MKLYAEFRHSAESFLICSPDNRIKLWDVDTKKETRNYVEKRHLSHSYTCWDWNHGKKDLGMFAAGTSDGSIIIWDLMRGIFSEFNSNFDLFY